MQSSRRWTGLAVASLFLIGMLQIPVASANPAVPYCSVASLGGGLTATADTAVMPDVCEQLTGRVFPEAFAHPAYGAGVLPATDFIGYFEFQRGLEYLAEQYPDYVTIHEVAQSAGLPNLLTQSRDHFPIYMVELTNKNSPIPLEDRQSLLFMLSIHGNEKGGREGGFRVLEDLAKGVGFAAEGIQNGAGTPEPIAKPTGGTVQTYHDYLDFQRIFLLFPNADGWAHDELEYFLPSPTDQGGFCGTLFCRTNGNGADLNRQAPTLGWQNPNRNVIGEPEAIGYYNWMLTEEIDWDYAIDIHGMLNHQNFIAIMLPAASMTPQEMQRSMRLAETLKERVNGNDHFALWETLLSTAEAVGEPVGGVMEQLGACEADPTGFVLGFAGVCGNPVNAIGSSQFAEYYTVIDAIGYTDSGFNGDYFAQDTGLNAPGYDIELAYNHITFDSQYELAALFNDYHVKSVREITKSFMDAAALDVQISFETGGVRTLYLEPTFVATNLDDEDPTPGADSWAVQNPGDDLWEYSLENPFFARPAKYWDDMRPFVRDGDAPGVLVKTSGDRVTASQLANFDTFVIPGSAISQIEMDADTIATVKAWVEDGGTLVLTDSALQFFDLAGITDNAVDVVPRYMGGIGMDLDHELLQKVRGGVKQTYEPTPLGYAVGASAAPNWFIDRSKFSALEGAEIAGTECGISTPGVRCPDNDIGLGQVPLGDGMIKFIGSLLPDPTEEFYHPYGLDHYATTYSGNQILRNMLGWDEVYLAPPVVITDDGQIVQTANEPEPQGDSEADSHDDSEDSPGVAAVAVFALLAALGVALRRRD